METHFTIKRSRLALFLVLALLAGITVRAGLMWLRNNKNWKQAKATYSEMVTSVENAQKWADSMSIALENAKEEIASQSAALNERDAKIAVLEARPTTSGSGISRGELTARDKHIASLEKALEECFKSKANASVPATATPAFVAPAASETTVTKPAATKTNLTAVNTRLPDAYWENGKIPFCVRLGGNSNRHLPHLAMRKTDFPDAASNSIGGFNWYLSQPTNDLTGDYGCTVDGTFFVSAALIDQYLVKADGDVVEVLAKAFGWTAKKMTKFGDYYISEK